jgi:hypothetical protein
MILKRQPRKTIKASDVAKRYGLSAKTVKRLADRHGWRKVTYNDRPTAPIFLFEAEVNEFFARRQGIT